MLIFSTSLNHTSLSHVLNQLIKDNSEDIMDVVDLVLRKTSPDVDIAWVFRTKMMAAEVMLNRGQVKPAQALLNDMRSEELLKWIPSEQKFGQVLNLHVFAGMPDRALEILDHPETGCQYDSERLIDQKIFLAWFMVIKGYTAHAETIIKTLKFLTLLTKPMQVEKLMALNINLSRFSHVTGMIEKIQGHEAHFSNIYIQLLNIMCLLGILERLKLRSLIMKNSENQQLRACFGKQNF